MYYHLPMNWRHAKFYLGHRSVVPEYSPTVDLPQFTVYLPAEQIIDLLAIRDWLYQRMIGYRLLGRHDTTTSFFHGIVFVFDDALDVVCFVQQWGK